MTEVRLGMYNDNFQPNNLGLGVEGDRERSDSRRKVVVPKNNQSRLLANRDRCTYLITTSDCVICAHTYIFFFSSSI